MIQLSVSGQRSATLNFLAEPELDIGAIGELCKQQRIKCKSIDSIYELIDMLEELETKMNCRFKVAEYIQSFEVLEVESQFGVAKFSNVDLLKIIGNPIITDGIWACM